MPLVHCKRAESGIAEKRCRQGRTAVHGAISAETTLAEHGIVADTANAARARRRFIDAAPHSLCSSRDSGHAADSCHWLDLHAAACANIGADFSATSGARHRGL